MGLPHGFMGDGHMHGYIANYELLLFHMLYQIKSLGFKVIFIMCGHYPFVGYARPAAHKFMQENPEIRVYAGMEADPIRDAISPSEQEGYIPQEHDMHAGKWETSIMKTLRPELVDMSQIPPNTSEPITSIIDPECGIFVAADPRCEDLEEYGRKITDKILEAMNLVCDGLLAEVAD